MAIFKALQKLDVSEVVRVLFGFGRFLVGWLMRGFLSWFGVFVGLLGLFLDELRVFTPTSARGEITQGDICRRQE